MMREKKMRRIAGFLLMAVMVFVLSVTAWADGEGVDVPKDQEEFTITLTGAREGHRYETYQIFKGDLLETVKDGAAEKKLSNIEWGSGVDLGKAVDGKTLAQALRENFGELADREDVSAADVAQVLAGQTEKTETAEKFADIAKRLSWSEGRREPAGRGWGEKYHLYDSRPRQAGTGVLSCERDHRGFGGA